MFGAMLGLFGGQETAAIDPFPIGVGPPTPLGLRCNLSPSRFHKSLGPSSGHLGCFLGSKMAYDSNMIVSRWLNMAFRWPQDG